MKLLSLSWDSVEGLFPEKWGRPLKGKRKPGQDEAL
jgi:hypothetical protein